MKELKQILEEVEKAFEENTEDVQDEEETHCYVINANVAYLLTKEIISKYLEEHSDIELKPCPFCGGVAEFVLGEQYSNDWIQCSSCGVETPCFDTPEEAAEAWNRRK